jgi:hypothetical protein
VPHAPEIADQSRPADPVEWVAEAVRRVRTELTPRVKETQMADDELRREHARTSKRRKVAVVSAALTCAAAGALGGTLALGATPGALAQHSYATRLASASMAGSPLDASLPGRGAYWMVPGTQFPLLGPESPLSGAPSVGNVSSGSTGGAGAGTVTGSVPSGGGSGGLGGVLPQVPGTLPQLTSSCIALPKKDAQDLGAALKKLGLSSKVRSGEIKVKVSSSGVKVCGPKLPKNLKKELVKVLGELIPPVTVPTVTVPTVTVPSLPGGGL